MSVDWSRVEALQRVGIGEFWDQPDVTANLQRRARHAAVAKYSPALANAWTVVNLGHQSVCLLDADLAPIDDGEIADPELLLDVLAERPTGAVGLRTGPRGDAWTMVGIRVATFRAWAAWLDSVAVVASEVEDGSGQTVIRYASRHCGKPGMVAWEQPEYPAGRASAVLRGAEVSQAGDLARSWGSDGDGGGYALFAALPDAKGRLPRFRGKTLAEGVETLADGAAIPVWARRGERTAELRGLPIDPTVEEAIQEWMAAALGGRY